jgi:uncharacterized membrane protein
MSNNNKKKIEPWRIIVFIVAVAFIIFMWVKNDVAEIYTTAPKEQIVPMIVTTVAVSILKIVAIAGVVFLAKWIIDKMKSKKKSFERYER